MSEAGKVTKKFTKEHIYTKMCSRTSMYSISFISSLIHINHFLFRTNHSSTLHHAFSSAPRLCVEPAKLYVVL
ncbi:hypothetical protein CROQUDRAFT_489549 [Cronartium quercuum f. sp. fusiforme G11]|uniref:Uncharacterized protein n=1 Tax=Cronartium quercuum f. sp. fusiforme G11 TaxID=708437 RepID=A0A9P6NHJ4_9BASI|nr:hypothetical protein CROQUDRAFT_489549 [Cronartium quercuum f. sp. fusiforme G11]